MLQMKPFLGSVVHLASHTQAVQLLMFERRQVLVCNSHLAASLCHVLDTHTPGWHMLRALSCLPDNMCLPRHFAYSCIVCNRLRFDISTSPVWTWLLKKHPAKVCMISFADKTFRHLTFAGRIQKREQKHQGRESRRLTWPGHGLQLTLCSARSTRTQTNSSASSEVSTHGCVLTELSCRHCKALEAFPA